MAERRRRLGRRHCLALSAKAIDPVDAARSMVALHSTDAPTVYLAALVRMASGTLSDVERALYEDRSLVRVMGMRRTVFAVPAELAPVVQAACGRGVATQERRNFHALLVKEGVTDDPAPWLQEVEAVAARALAALGESTAAELGCRSTPGHHHRAESRQGL